MPSPVNHRPGPGENPSEVVYAAILAQAAPIARMPLALEAELAVSALLGGVYAATDPSPEGAAARVEAVRRFAADFGDYLTARPTPEAQAVRAALAALLPGAASSREQVTGGSDNGNAGTPAWTRAAGKVSCTGTWAVRDGYGDQTSYVATFGYQDPERGGPEHAVSYLLDHNLGIVKSLSIGVPADQVVDGWREEAERDAGVSLDPVDPGRLRADVTGYLAPTDAQPKPPGERYVEERTFAVSRLELLPKPDLPAVRPTLGDAERDAVVADFLAAPEASGVGGPEGRPATTIVAWGARAAVDFAVDDNAGDPLRWSPAAVELMLLDWAPRQLSRTHEAGPWLPEVLDAFVSYAGRVTGRPPERVEATRDAITNAAVQYTDLMTGELLGEPVTDVLARMVSDGVDPLDEDAVLRWVLADRARRGEQ